MTKKKVTIEFTFKEKTEEDGWTHLEISRVRLKDSDLTKEQLDSIWEDASQSDFWQIDVWADIQKALGGGGSTSY